MKTKNQFFRTHIKWRRGGFTKPFFARCGLSILLYFYTIEHIYLILLQVIIIRIDLSRLKIFGFFVTLVGKSKFIFIVFLKKWGKACKRFVKKKHILSLSSELNIPSSPASKNITITYLFHRFIKSRCQNPTKGHAKFSWNNC